VLQTETIIVIYTLWFVGAFLLAWIMLKVNS